MYKEYWGFKDSPFRNTPDPNYLYFSKQHEEALMRALYVITEGQGAMMLTGECGCGKTLITRAIIDELDPERFEVALLPYPNLQPDEFLREILRQFGYDPAGWDKSRLLRQLADFLQATCKRNARTLVIIDEAQLVENPSTLEEIRLLLNFQQDRRFFLTLLLIGQPELRKVVEARPQLAQRLAVRWHLGAMSEEDSLGYFSHRLQVAGGSRDFFTREAERLLVKSSGGVPRRINLIGDLSLLNGFGRKAPLIDEDLVGRVVADLAE